jgi:uncharacterized protein
MPADRAFDRKTRVLLVALAVVCVTSLATAGVLFERERDGSGRSVFTAPTVSSAAPAERAAAPRRARPPSAARPLRLWVGGDSLAAGPSWAIFEAARATGVIRPLAEYQVGTGLVRNEYWDWQRHLEAVVRARNPRVVVFMVGANDDQALAVDGTSYRAPAPEWVAEYRRRVAGIMDVLAGAGRKVVWIGMPPMREPSYSEAMGLIGGIMAEEAATRPAVTYVDAFAMFSTPGAPGVYAPSIPDEAGEPTEVRLDDGIHLNVAGSQYLARRVMEEVDRLVGLPDASP